MVAQREAFLSTLNAPRGEANVLLEATPQKLRRTGGSVVEFSPATREARVRFPASAL